MRDPIIRSLSVLTRILSIFGHMGRVFLLWSLILHLYGRPRCV